MSLKINAETTRCTYSRLKYVFRNNLNYSGKFYENLTLAKNPVIGNLPDELLRCICEKYPSGKGERIKEVQRIFAKAAEFFRRDALKTDKLIDKLVKEKNIGELIHLSDDLFVNKNAQSRFKQKAFSSRAGALFRKNFSDFLPKNTDIKIDWIAQGACSDAFVMHFLNQTGENIFRPKVLKIYKLQQYLTAKTLNAILSDGGKAAYNYLKNEIPSSRSADVYASIMLEELVDKMKFVEERKRMHGAAAEANSFYYLLKAYGLNLRGTDFVKFDMFDIRNGFSIGDYIDNNSFPVKKKINLKKLGLLHTDLKPRNIVSDVCVDIGGLKSVNEELTDGYIRKIYKELVSQTDKQKLDKLIKYYQNLLLQNRVPDKQKIQRALDLFMINQKNV